MTVRDVGTVVVGAGPAGLACAASLRRAGEPALLLERAASIGASWRRHYDRLHLHTDRKRSALPFVPYPASDGRYPSRDAVVRYLEGYAATLGLEPRLGEEVGSLRRAAEGWTVSTSRARYRARNVIVATGYARVPVRPEWPGQGSFRGAVLHSSEYRNGAPFAERDVLVVGFGNSGGEIALDLAEHGARPTMSVRGPVNIVPRDILGIPVLALSEVTARLPTWLADGLTGPLRRLLRGNLERYGLRRLDYGPMCQIREHARVPLIDIGTIAGIRRGAIRVRPGIASFGARSVRFVDGREEPFDAVVLATGYRPRVDELLGDDPVLDGGGTPLRSGVESAPGLYFCGFWVSPFGMLREIGRESVAIAEAVAARRA